MTNVNNFLTNHGYIATVTVGGGIQQIRSAGNHTLFSDFQKQQFKVSEYALIPVSSKKMEYAKRKNGNPVFSNPSTVFLYTRLNEADKTTLKEQNPKTFKEEVLAAIISRVHDSTTKLKHAKISFKSDLFSFTAQYNWDKKKFIINND